MTIRAYHWDDPGAPELPNIGSQRLIDNLRIILKACLVDGYGDKPGAGWTLGHDLPDGFSLGNGNGWINVVSTSSLSGVEVHILEEITDFSSPLAVGVNRRSGRNSEGYVSNWLTRPQVSGFRGTYTWRGWTVIADSRTVTVFGQGGSPNTSQNVDVSNSYGFMWHFGDYITIDAQPGFIALCGNESSSGAGTISSYWTGSGGMSLRNPFTNLVDQGSNPYYRASLPTFSTTSVTSAQSQYVLPRASSYPLCRTNLAAGGLAEAPSISRPTPLGLLRGILFIPTITAVYSEEVLKKVFGVENPTPEDKFKVLPNILEEGHPGLYMVYPNTADLGAFVSLDPRDWE